ncbi:Helicase [Imperialibacter sp. EC-SDR9]|nr:Helicase [Imperialibacter sp. 75]CAD5287212.1 Helicase [Imperialibacter sp. 89]VVT06150.1 Helicase [Imperialibacter sp. EC-SDR9]
MLSTLNAGRSTDRPVSFYNFLNFTISMKNSDTSNQLFQLAASFVNHTSRHLFLTGKAGTGKTTFLKHIVETTGKNYVVVAPTGVAAINAGGVTMHSFFQLPFGPFLPIKRSWTGQETDGAHDKLSLFQKMKMHSNKRKLMQELQLLIIDEVSMVRADMLDAIDQILRHFRRRFHEPFGGVQVLLIGDLYQLPPVVQDHEWTLLEEHYKSPFFFDAHVMSEASVLRIELQKIYRQTEKDFIGLLNGIRTNTVTGEQLALLNRRFLPDFRIPEGENYITLTSHNHKAHAINEEELLKLPGKTYNFKASVEGEFSDRAYPADEVLQLKVGAQVMFIRNDKGEERQYYNGKIGIVKSIDDDKIIVSTPEDNSTIRLIQEEWQNMHYSYNTEKNSIDEKIMGRFKQYPVRLAWAITIHKSQGLTFDKAIIDAGQSFASGQVYVALSRLTNMEGLVLRSAIPAQSILSDDKVNEFVAQSESEESLSPLLKIEQKAFIENKLTTTFQWQPVCQEVTDFYKGFDGRQVPNKEEAVELFSKMVQTTLGHKNVADKFLAQLQGLLPHAEQDRYAELHERMSAAQAYFDKRMAEEVFQPLKAHIASMMKKQRIKKYLKELHALQVQLLARQQLIEQALLLTKGLSEGIDSSQVLQQADKHSREVVEKLPPPPRLPKAKAGDSKQTSMDLFKKGKSIADIAEERGLAFGTIEAHLIDFVKTGELSIFDLVPVEKVEKILPLVQKSENFSATPIKVQLGDDYSYNDIRAVFNHFIWNQSQN